MQINIDQRLCMQGWALFIWIELINITLRASVRTLLMAKSIDNEILDTDLSHLYCVALFHHLPMSVARHGTTTSLLLCWICRPDGAEKV